jgi:hypothetical protein
VAAARWQIESIGREEGYIVFKYTNRPKIDELKRATRNRLRIVDDGSAYWPLDNNNLDADRLLAIVESVLQSG